MNPMIVQLFFIWSSTSTRIIFRSSSLKSYVKRYIQISFNWWQIFRCEKDLPITWQYIGTVKCVEELEFFAVAEIMTMVKSSMKSASLGQAGNKTGALLISNRHKRETWSFKIGENYLAESQRTIEYLGVLIEHKPETILKEMREMFRKHPGICYL